MANYITAFNTLADYEAAKENLDFPNVTLIDEDGSLRYEKSAPTPPPTPTGCTFTISTDGESLIGQTIPTSFKFLKTAVDANHNGYVEWNTSDGHTFGIDFEFSCVGYGKDGDVNWQEYVDGGDGYYYTNVWPEDDLVGVPPANLTIESVSEVRDLVTPYDIECIPSHDYSQDYFTMNIATGGDIVWSGSTTANTLSYSKDNGTTWATADSATTISVNVGNKVLWKGTPTPSTLDGIGMFSGDTNVRYSVEGNAMSLLFGDNFVNQTSLSGKDYAFANLFVGNINVTSAENMILPATTLTYECYGEMFYRCESLTTAPELPATTLTYECYREMFYGCTSLTTAPELPATVLAQSCYSNMFDSCTSLTKAPKLPVTTLADYCYSNMFSNCTSLTTAPELPATVLAEGCYNNMFQGCSSLTSAPELPATTLASNCYEGMFFDCTSLTTAPVLSATTLADYCYSNMFSNCTSLTSAPVLSATTLASNCYSNMFDSCESLTTAPKLPAVYLATECYSSMFMGCTSLTTAPELPATVLAEGCYINMFSDCNSLNYIKCLATDISASDCTSNWVNGVASSGTFVKAASMTDWTTGSDGIPNDWGVQNA